MAKIYVLGDVMLDVELRGSRRENYEGAESCVIGDHWLFYPGGAANVAALLGHWGHEVTLFGFVGKDWEGQKLMQLLNQCGVRHKLLRTFPRTTAKYRAYAEGEIISRLDCESPNASSWAARECLCLVDSVPPDCLVFSDYNKGAFGLHSERQVQALIGKDFPTIVDPKPSGYERIWRGADIIAPNLREFELLESSGFTGDFRYVVVTTGADGARLYVAEQSILVPPPIQVTHLQVVGAGDVLIAGLAAALVAGAELNSWGSMESAVRCAVDKATDYVAHPRREAYGKLN